MAFSHSSASTKSGGQFAPKLGGQFGAKQGGHFKMKLGGQYVRNVHHTGPRLLTIILSALATIRCFFFLFLHFDFLPEE